MREGTVKACICEFQSQALICLGTENLHSRLSCVVTQGTVNVIGPLVLLTQYVLISFGVLGLLEPCSITRVW